MIQSDSHRSQHLNQQSCQAKLQNILEEAEKACEPAAQPSREQMERVEGFKKKFEVERVKEKAMRRDTKQSRNMKNNWRSDDR